MKKQMKELVETEWHPSSSSNTAVFRTDEGQLKAQGSNDYFLDSATAVHYFAEKDALLGNEELKKEYYQNKVSALNKVGHALHTLPSSAFHAYATSEKIKSLVHELGWIDPVIPQSMYIFKQSKIGGEVTSHQDSTFLYTTPKQSCLGLWLALDDATMENGCLWVRPKSHLESVRRKFKRNPDYFGNSDKAPSSTPPPKLIFEDLVDVQTQKDICPWEGALPENHTFQGLLDVGFVPIECKAGDLVVFPGTLDHLSLANTSKKSRHTFQLHLVEGYYVAGVTWDESNWLQYPNGMSFLSILNE
uniref:Uncharacterized protein n=2 Tax=Ditylum brightwellii TaxID=49249 RepID=A0A7S4WC89_9STRA|mmetsp:Transcript_13840/g.18523  ORF Transcript_13840/g.18523 Transcript_13840/m.18523 type:complete len:303 (+) Transcript_13840:57-965(+)